MVEPYRVVILGGGTAGYMCAAAMTARLDPRDFSISLVESAEIGTVGVGEATLPHIRDFNRYVGLDEAEFMRKTQASFKLGIEFVDWGNIGSNYIHPFGAFGQAWGGVEFHNYWVRAKAEGADVGSLEDYCFPIVASRRRRFEFPSEDVDTIQSTYSYAYHFDAGLYAAFLREKSEAAGLRRIEGKVAGVDLDPATGNIAALTLEGGRRIEGDLFIDCSGFRALLIGDTLGVSWEDWTPWLPCDRAMAVPCESSGDLTPFTRSTAVEAGWMWRIPLQHRTGNGYVYSSRFISDDEAAARLLEQLDGKALGDPRPLRFSAGRRLGSWYRNCVAMGLASGFLEPLESTSIYLVQVAITNLLQMFPGRRSDPRLADEFNRLVDIEYGRVRDFLILHYWANRRDDGELWRYTRDMPVPDSLTYRLEQFRHRGHIPKYKDGLFSPHSWLAVYAGQGILPEGYNPQADVMPAVMVGDRLRDLRGRIGTAVDAMPTHADFLRDFCRVAGRAPAMAEGGR